MFQRILLVLGALLILFVGVVYFLGRGKVEETPRPAAQSASEGESSRLQTLRLYFGDPSRVALRSEDRVIVAGQSLTDRLRACVNELAAGSLTGGTPVLPPTTRLTKAFVDPWGLAYLEFDRSILGSQTPGDGEEWLAVASIVRSICDNFPEVHEVRFMIDGLVVTSLAGYVDLEEPLRAEDFPLSARGAGPQ